MELRRVAPVVGLVVLLAVDAVLIGWAFRPPPADDYVPTAASTSTGKFTLPKAVPVEQYVTAVGPDIAWVANAGSCADPGDVWVTKDKGDSWTRNALPGRVLRLLAESSTDARAVGGDESDKCSLKLWTSSNAGGDWGEPGDAALAWSRDPTDRMAVHTPGDETVRPCGPRTVIDLSVLDGSRATVLCVNGDVYATTDGGGGWRKAYTVKSALALTVAEGGRGVVLKADAKCKGVVALPIVSGKPAKKGECVVAPAPNGQISVSNAVNGWWLLVGPKVFTAEEPTGPWSRTGEDALG